MVKICLSAIVKNESQIIERYLNAAKFALDYVCITDTGSTDNTVSLINKWGKDHNIPTKVCYDPWKNFGENRSKALDNSAESFPDADYLLLLDADMILEDHGFKKEDLKADSYLLNQYNGIIEYGNVRLVSTKIKWCYMGVTHEYITPKEKCHDRRELCTTLKINDIGDGGSKETKFQRDEKLLRDALKNISINDPLRDRYNFYLAQTYFDTGKFSKALRYYRERIKGEGFFAEKWFAQYKIGICLDKLDRWEEAEVELLKAYQMYHSRTEPLVHLVTHYILYSNPPEHFKADLFIPRLQEMKKEPYTDELFNHTFHKDYYIDYLTGINSYYVSKYQLGYDACKSIIDSNITPEHYKEQARKNIQYYINKLRLDNE